MTTNQPTQPDMFEPPEKFGNYLAEKSLAAFNQPTDATQSAGEAISIYDELDRLRAQKNDAYSERNKCVVGLALLAQSLGYIVGVAQHPVEDTFWEDDWRNILVIELPTGQVTWHFHDSESALLEQFPKLESHTWDGHTTPEKYERVLACKPTNIASQLATAQAQAKALEAWVSDVYTRLDETDCDCSPADDYVCEMCKVLYQTPKPQPVDASSLARIARVALVAYKFMHAEKSTNCGIDFWSEFVDAYNAIQPNDIALAQALAGGA